MRPPGYTGSGFGKGGAGGFGKGGAGGGVGMGDMPGYYGPWPIATAKPDWAYKGGGKARWPRADSHGGMYVPGGYVAEGEFYRSTPQSCMYATSTQTYIYHIPTVVSNAHD